MSALNDSEPVPTREINDDIEIPQIGLGTYKLTGHECEATVRRAIEVGYRHFDTAALYDNEESVGKALNAAMSAGEVAREELFVTSKVWHDHQGADKVGAAYQESLRKLNLDYLDLYLIHWPWPQGGKFVETFEAMARLEGMGQVRSIGVANFYEEVLQELIDATGIVPSVNQVELHPMFTQPGLREFHEQHGIITEAWSPLLRGKVLNNPDIKAIAAALERTPGQVVLRYLIQLGVVVIPKTSNPNRLVENFAVKDFRLSRDDMDVIASLDGPHGRHFKDPREFPGEEA
ncbi:MAG: aldo/keto reductase [Corynebacterium sp.]|nr:aldo/keto reductase [Corynebacterium sp.]